MGNVDWWFRGRVIVLLELYDKYIGSWSVEDDLKEFLNISIGDEYLKLFLSLTDIYYISQNLISAAHLTKIYFYF